MARMRHSVLICEIREIRGQKIYHALPWIIEDQHRFMLHAFVTLGCGRSPRQDLFRCSILKPGSSLLAPRLFSSFLHNLKHRNPVTALFSLSVMLKR